MPKIVKNILALIFTVFLAAVFFRNAVCRFLIISAVKQVTELEVSIDKLNLDLLRSNLNIAGLTVSNPRQINNRPTGEVKRIFIKYDLLSLLVKRLHFQEIKILLGRIDFITDKNSGLNLTNFGQMQDVVKIADNLLPAKTDIPKKQPQPVKQKKAQELLIDRLEISFEQVSFTNYTTQNNTPAVIVFTAAGPYVFHKVKSLKGVVNYVSTESGFKGLLNGILRNTQR